RPCSLLQGTGRYTPHHRLEESARLILMLRGVAHTCLFYEQGERPTDERRRVRKTGVIALQNG
ncbi:MAG: hypothetical protein M0Z58_00355, partial [Nitrospiraceae bacterium]|nr:hypothetical protein [Nitrospiraceae bacterium]